MRKKKPNQDFFVAIFLGLNALQRTPRPPSSPPPLLARSLHVLVCSTIFNANDSHFNNYHPVTFLTLCLLISYYLHIFIILILYFFYIHLHHLYSIYTYFIF